MLNLFPYTFAHPQYFGSLAVPAFVYWFFYKRNTYYPSFNIPQHGGVFKPTNTPLKVKLLALYCLFKNISICILVTALARPKVLCRRKKYQHKESTLFYPRYFGLYAGKDFEPDRLEAAKSSDEFYKRTPNDRIGLVILFGRKFTQCPITIDHQGLLNLFKDIQSGMVEDKPQ